MSRAPHPAPGGAVHAGRLLRALVGALLLLLGVASAQPTDAGDALAGGLTPPTGARFADPAWYDLVGVTWSGDALAPVLEIEWAAIDAEVPLRQPIVEAYLLTADGAGTTLLPGSGLAPPAGFGWSVALRATSAGAWAWRSGAGEAVPQALDATVAGRRLRLAWPPGWPTDGVWVAISGVHDPFSASGWRALATAPSPWAFSAASPVPPVVDVLPGDGDALARLQRSGRLPAPTVRPPRGAGSVWWWWMVGGLALAVGGLLWRGRGTGAGHGDGGSAAAAGPVGRGGDDPTGAVVDAGTPRGQGDDPPPAAAVDVAAASADGALIGDADVVGPEPDERLEGVAATPQSPDASRGADVGTATGSTDGAGSTAPSSERTTRAPSDANRSAKRS